MHFSHNILGRTPTLNLSLLLGEKKRRQKRGKKPTISKGFNSPTCFILSPTSVLLPIISYGRTFLEYLHEPIYDPTCTFNLIYAIKPDYSELLENLMACTVQRIVKLDNLVKYSILFKTPSSSWNFFPSPLQKKTQTYFQRFIIFVSICNCTLFHHTYNVTNKLPLKCVWAFSVTIHIFKGNTSIFGCWLSFRIW